MTKENLPAPTGKPELREWLQSFLPFELPTLPIPLRQTAKNLDIAIARIIAAGGENIAGRINRSTNLIAAKSKAERKAIDTVTEFAAAQISEGGPLADRALDYAFRESVLKQQNREEIAKKAAEELGRDPPNDDSASEIDPDWVTNFARLAENVSNDQLQQLWGKILAGEIQHPGSFRISTLHRVSLLSREDAQLLYKFLRFAVDQNFIFKSDALREILPPHEAILVDQLGLVTGSEGFLNTVVTLQAGKEKSLISHDLAVIIIPDKDARISIPCLVLTPFGRDLLSLSNNFEAVPEYIDALALFLKGKQIGKIRVAQVKAFDKELGGHPVIATRDI